MTFQMTKEYATEIREMLEQIRQTGETSMDGEMCEKMNEMLKPLIPTFQFTVLRVYELLLYIRWVRDIGYNYLHSSDLPNVIYAILAYMRTKELTEQEMNICKSLIWESVQWMLYNNDHRFSLIVADVYIPYEMTKLCVTQGTATATLDELQKIHTIFKNEQIPPNLIQTYFPPYAEFDRIQHIRNTCGKVFELVTQLF